MRFEPYDLSEGAIWQKPITLDIRVVESLTWTLPKSVCYVRYSDIGGTSFIITRKSFIQWIDRNDAQKIGFYDFEEKKVRRLK